MDAKTNEKDTDLKLLRPSYELRSRSVLKRPKKKLSETQLSSNSPKLSTAKKCGRKYLKRHCSPPPLPPVSAEDVEMEDYSQQSVSMLQDCYQDEFPHLKETCMNSELEELDIYSEEEVADEPEFLKVENSTQTDFSLQLNHPKEKEMAAHARFISSVVRLKAALSSKKTMSNKELWKIINKSAEEEHEGTGSKGQAVPKETVGYVLRSSDVDEIFNETVRVLLQHLENALENDISKIMLCWKNSVYETVVEMLAQAVDSEPGVLQMVTSFLRRVIESILIDSEKSKNLILESKASIVVSFCQSTHLTVNITNSIVKELSALKTIKRHDERSSATQKLSWAYLTKNSYFLLRILESSLELLRSKLNGGEIKDAVTKRPEGKKYNVLEMWRKQWGGDETQFEPEIGHEWKVMVSDWCDKLDDVLLHCVNHVPVVSLAVERCGELGKDILKMCHSSKIKS